jgi:hypothetical protein
MCKNVTMKSIVLALTYTREKIKGKVWWLKPVILATWEAEIGKTEVQGPPQAESS